MAKTQPLKPSSTPTDQLRDEYERNRKLFEIQPVILQRYFESQARQIAEAYIERAHNLHFTLPDRVFPDQGKEPLPVPAGLREQKVGGLRDRFSRLDVHDTFRRRLTELEQSPEKSVALCSGLFRYATANYMINNLLPLGNKVTYLQTDDDIPNIPAKRGKEPESAITASTDAIVEGEGREKQRGNLQVPYVSVARRFFLPQWVAFDEKGKLLVNSISEAEAHIASMQKFLNILFAARSLAPWMVIDKEFEAKRYGILGQLVNQGRAFANHQTREIVNEINKRVAAQSLNRGLSLNLPYFDDQDLTLKYYDFVVIPAGRIMFVPAFVVRAVVEEQAKLNQDTRFNNSTRRHLLAELQILGKAFN